MYRLLLRESRDCGNNVGETGTMRGIVEKETAFGIHV